MPLSLTESGFSEFRKVASNFMKCQTTSFFIGEKMG